MLTLDHATPDDMPRVFAITSDAFGHEHPYIEHVFPAHSTPSGRVAGAQRFREMQATDPHTTFLKVTDSELTGPDAIIGIAKWNVWDNVIPEEVELDGPWWDDVEGEEGDKVYAQALFRTYMVERRKALRESGGHLISLDLLAVDPAHHHRGAGSMLTKWGVDVADRLRVDTVVEASIYARHLYEQFGFRYVKFVTMNMPEPWAERPKQRFFWMVRPKKETRDVNIDA